MLRSIVYVILSLVVGAMAPREWNPVTAVPVRPAWPEEPLPHRGAQVELGGLKSRVPDTWTMQEPSNKLRLYQAVIKRVDGDKEDAELVIFFFGPGGGGGAKDNITRWKAQFVPPAGKTIDDVSKVDRFKVSQGVDVICLDITGTLKFKNPPFNPIAKEERKEGFRRFSVIFESDKGAYFITLTGPARTVALHKEAFDSWIKAFK